MSIEILTLSQQEEDDLEIIYKMWRRLGGEKFLDLCRSAGTVQGDDADVIKILIDRYSEEDFSLMVDIAVERISEERFNQILGVLKANGVLNNITDATPEEAEIALRNRLMGR